MNRILLSIALVFVLSLAGLAQNAFWSPMPASVLTQKNGVRLLKPAIAQAFSLNLEAFANKINTSPTEFSGQGQVVQIPMPNGQFRSFEFFDSPIMQPGLMAKYPEIKTFSARAVDNYNIQGRFDITPEGFHGYILGLGSPVIIDPIYKDNNKLYQVFFRKDLHDRAHSDKPFVCEVESLDPVGNSTFDEVQNTNETLAFTTTESVTLRTYRLVITTTGEYSAIYGNTKPTVLAEVVKAINRINSITERDFAVRYILVDGTDEVFFFDADSDPFTNGNTGAMIDENLGAINTKFTFGEYDMGHVFGTSGGGLAQLGSVCGGGKARGVTSAGGNQGDQFYVDFVAHEIGHQMGSNHTFNNCSGFAGGNENSGTAYEPGSGSTIMSYSGICGINNILFDSEPYYHVSSLREITNFMVTGGGNICAEKTETNNHFPVSTIPREEGFFIPISTAFRLEGEGADEDGDIMTYSWEQWNLGPISNIGSPTGNSPLFKYIPPSDKTYRFFPKLTSIFSGASDNTEVLPTYSRDLDFQFVVRDNHPGGGASAWTKISFEATEDAGPFVVTSPGLSNKEWFVGEYAKVKWNVANTDKMPVNCQAVNIRLIKGQDFENSVLLATDMPNNGIAYVLVPDQVATGYHVMVEAADNVFLDASNSSHKITVATDSVLSAGISKTAIKVCAPATEQLMIGTTGLGGYSKEVNLSILGDAPTGANISLASTTLNPGESTNLILDFENISVYEPFDIQIAVKGEGMDTIKLDLHIDVVNFDYSPLVQMNPANGAIGIETFPTLAWSEVEGFNLFNIQLSASPNFEPENLIVEKFNATGTSYTSTAPLEVNHQYFWRIQTLNECGISPWTQPAAFSTKYVNCSAIPANDLPLQISTNNPGTFTSVINITSSGNVSDLNIKHLKGIHKNIGELSFKITAPTGQTAELINNKCISLNKEFDWDFDDASTQTNPCILVGAIKPEQPLSVFTGLNTQGDWTLSVTDNTVGSGGQITEWNIELCSDATLNAPFIVNNNQLSIEGEAEKMIPTDLLLVEDTDNTASELTYTIAIQPLHGEIKLNGEVATTFTQANVSAGQVTYHNFGGPDTADEFYFTVFDGAGGVIPVTKFEIAVSPVGFEFITKNSFMLYPNPTSGNVRIEFIESTNNLVDIQVVDITGRVLLSFDKKLGSTIQFPTQGLESGVYFVKVRQAGKLSVAKLTVLK